MALQKLKPEGIESVSNLTTRKRTVRNRNNGTLRRTEIVNHDLTMLPQGLAQNLAESGNEMEKIFFFVRLHRISPVWNAGQGFPHHPAKAVDIVLRFQNLTMGGRSGWHSYSSLTAIPCTSKRAPKRSLPTYKRSGR